MHYTAGEYQVRNSFWGGKVITDGRTTTFKNNGCFFHGFIKCHHENDWNHPVGMKQKMDGLMKAGFTIRFRWESEVGCYERRQMGSSWSQPGPNCPGPYPQRCFLAAGQCHLSVLQSRPWWKDTVTTYFRMVTIKVCLHGLFALEPLTSMNGKLLFSLSETCQACCWWMELPCSCLVHPGTEQDSGAGLQLWNLWGLAFWVERQQPFLGLHKDMPLPEAGSFRLPSLVCRCRWNPATYATDYRQKHAVL